MYESPSSPSPLLIMTLSRAGVFPLPHQVVEGHDHEKEKVYEERRKAKQRKQQSSRAEQYWDTGRKEEKSSYLEGEVLRRYTSSSGNSRHCLYCICLEPIHSLYVF